MALNLTNMLPPISNLVSTQLSLTELEYHVSPFHIHGYQTVGKLAVLIALSLFISMTLSRWTTTQGNASFIAPFAVSRYSSIARIAMFYSASEIIKKAHAQYEDKPWKLAGNDVIILPHKYLKEVRQLPSHVVDAMQANLDNMQGKYTHLDVLYTTRLFVHVLIHRVNPKLGVLIPTLRKELDEALLKLLPNTLENEWISVEAFKTFHTAVGRISSRLFVGEELKDNERWLRAAEQYVTNIFKTTVAVRLVPTELRDLASWFIPVAWQMGWNAREAHRILIPYIRYRKSMLKKRGSEIQQNEKAEFPDVLEYLIEEARGEDIEDSRLAGMVLSLSLASNHTTAMALVEALYDLCIHREYHDELREEVEDAVLSGGGWTKQAMLQMRKLDSFIKESQRMHPPSLSYKRKLTQQVILSDGLRLPKGAHIEFAIVAIQNDHTTDPEHFDGLRYFHMRQSRPEESFRHQFATTSEHVLHFGHGAGSCPGRFLASNVIKMVLGSLLTDFELKLDGEEVKRPEGIHAFEYNFPSPTARIMLRRRCVDTPNRTM